MICETNGLLLNGCVCPQGQQPDDFGSQCQDKPPEPRQPGEDAAIAARYPGTWPRLCCPVTSTGPLTATTKRVGRAAGRS